MPNRSNRKRVDEQRFPIRIRIAVPEEGLGRQLDAAYAWLDQQVGKDNYGWNADGHPGLDASSIYLADPSVAVKLLEALGELGLELAVLSSSENRF